MTEWPELRGKAIDESHISVNGEVKEAPVNLSEYKGEDVVIRGDQVTRRIDS